MTLDPNRLPANICLLEPRRLSEYTRVASESRARAVTIASAKAEVARLAADKQARDDDAVAARLFEIAERGLGDKPGDHPLNRHENFFIPSATVRTRRLPALDVLAHAHLS